MNTKKLITLFLSLILFVSLMSIAPSAGGIIILFPLDGEVLYESPSSFFVSQDEFEKTVIYLDGELYSENTEAEVLVKEPLTLGEHTLKAVGILPDGSAKCDEVSFSLKMQSVNDVGSWKEEKITFDTLPDAYAEGCAMDAEVADSFLESYGWNLIYTHPSGTDPLTRKLTRIEGKNHNTDKNDWAPLLSYGNVNDTAWSGLGGMNFAGADKTREAMQKAGGVYTVEFDLLTFDNSPSIFLYLPFAMWGETSYNGQYLLTNGSDKLRDTNVAVTAGVWHSFKMQYDITNDKWYVFFDGEKVVDGIAARSTYHNSDIVRIEIIAKKDAQNMFAIDNFKMSHEKVYDGVKGIEFISPEGTSTDKTNFSPDVTEIKVTLSDKLDNLKKEDITLRTTEGRKIDAEINYDSENGILSIFPKKSITPGCDMEIVYSGNSLPSDFVYKIRSGSSIKQEITYKSGEKDIYSLKQLEGKSELDCYADISLFEGVESFDGVYILTVSQNNKIVSMTAENVTLSGEKVSDKIKLSVSLPENAENADILLMLCDSFTGCIAQSKYIKLK